MEKYAIKVKNGEDLPFDQVVDLYNSLKWYAYTNEKQITKLQDALNNSTYIVSAWEKEKLVGFARCLSDDASIFYLQDILIHPDHQRKGLGRKLLQNCVNRFEHVKTKMLLTGDEDKQKTFYESLGYRNTKECTKVKLNAFVIINDVDLA